MDNLLKKYKSSLSLDEEPAVRGPCVSSVDSTDDDDDDNDGVVVVSVVVARAEVELVVCFEVVLVGPPGESVV